MAQAGRDERLLAQGALEAPPRRAAQRAEEILPAESVEAPI